MSRCSSCQDYCCKLVNKDGLRVKKPQNKTTINKAYCITKKKQCCAIMNGQIADEMKGKPDAQANGLHYVGDSAFASYVYRQNFH